MVSIGAPRFTGFLCNNRYCAYKCISAVYRDKVYDPVFGVFRWTKYVPYMLFCKDAVRGGTITTVNTYKLNGTIFTVSLAFYFAFMIIPAQFYI